MSSRFAGASVAGARIVAITALAAVGLFAQQAAAQEGGGAPVGPPPTPQADARFDMTGNWVSVISEDWRWRMITPEKGDYAGVPITTDARRAADLWNPAADEASGNQCRAYGVGGIMRMPGRLRITWDNPTTLKIEADAGTQTRLLRFGNPPPPSGAPTWQGHSVATWEGASANEKEGPRGGTLKVVTTRMRAGYLRKNGIPYGETTNVTEYFHQFKDGNDDWLVVTTIVTDPKNLIQPFMTSSHFKKEPDGSKWNPTPCQAS